MFNYNDFYNGVPSPKEEMWFRVRLNRACRQSGYTIFGTTGHFPYTHLVTTVERYESGDLPCCENCESKIVFK